MSNSNIVVSVLYLKEASDLLVNDEPDVSLTLLKLAKALLESYKIPEEQVNEAKQASDMIIDVSSTVIPETNISSDTTKDK